MTVVSLEITNYKWSIVSFCSHNNHPRVNYTIINKLAHMCMRDWLRIAAQ